MSLRILITGSSGRLGSVLVRRLAQVADVVQFDTEAPESTQAKLGSAIMGSITDTEAVRQALDQVDAVVHSAAFPGDIKPFERLVQVNVQGTFNLLNQAGRLDRIQQFIYVSSICWHGLSQPAGAPNPPESLPISEEHPSRTANCYSATKVQSEYWCQWYAGVYRKPAVAVRPSYIFVPTEERPFLSRPAPDRPNLLDYVGVHDLAEGIAACLDYYPRDGFDRFLFNAADQPTDLPSLELARTMYPGVPVDEAKLSRENGFGAFVDCGHATEALGWKPILRRKR